MEASCARAATAIVNKARHSRISDFSDCAVARMSAKVLSAASGDARLKPERERGQKRSALSPLNCLKREYEPLLRRTECITRGTPAARQTPTPARAPRARSAVRSPDRRRAWTRIERAATSNLQGGRARPVEAYPSRRRHICRGTFSHNQNTRSSNWPACAAHIDSRSRPSRRPRADKPTNSARSVPSATRGSTPADTRESESQE